MTGSVSRKTSFLIAGEKLEDGRLAETSTKYKKALELGTKILNESAFDDFLFESNYNLMKII